MYRTKKSGTNTNVNGKANSQHIPHLQKMLILNAQNIQNLNHDHGIHLRYRSKPLYRCALVKVPNCAHTQGNRAFRK